MKKDTAEQWLLLEQSGELDAVRRWLLRRHLQAHPEDCAYRDDLDRITRAARAQGPDKPLSPYVLETLRAAAREAHTRSEQIVFRPALSPVAWTRPALVAAGLTLLVLGGLWLARKPEAPLQVVRTPPGATVSSPQPEIESAFPAAPSRNAQLAWEDDFDTELAELSSLVAVSDTEWEDAGSQATDADAVARELLELGGTKI